MKTINILPVFILLTLTFSSCENMFEYSPYSSSVSDNLKNTTFKNINFLKQLTNDDRNYIKIAVLSDIHNNYYKLEDAVDRINRDYDIDFTIVPGDLTDLGSIKEFQFAKEGLDDLVMPYFTVIGNHDYRSNGKEIYSQMFGENNYVIYYKNLKLIFFDDIVWESDKAPDFAWIKEQLADSLDMKKIIITHLPPNSCVYESNGETLNDIITTSGASMVIDGHTHEYCLNSVNDIPYLTCCSINRDQYVVVTIQNNSIEIEKIDF